MPNKKLSRKTELEKSVFEREIKMCQKLSKKNKGGCNWGQCKNCGVLFLLQKLYKGELIEDKDEIKEVRKNVLEL